MARSAAAIEARLLPKSRADLARQILLFCGAYYLYRLVRGQVDGRAAQAFDNARGIVDFERMLGIFPEPAVNAWATAHHAVGEFAALMYVNSHFTITVATLAFLYLRRNDGFYFVRNMFMISMALALVLYVVFPTAPPRFLPELGFADTVADHTGVRPGSSVDALYNPFAAVPSMHVAFALMLGGAMQATARRVWVRGLWAAYPVLVTFVVIASANHWWLDAAFGALVAVVSAAGAHALAARRPQAWALRPATG
jgi:membrane-associated phospholipid phosphatase